MWYYGVGTVSYTHLDVYKRQGIHLLNGICKDPGLQIFTIKTKVMDFCGTYTVQTKIVIDTTVLEQVSSFEYLGYSVSVSYTHLDVYKRQHKDLCNLFTTSLIAL